MDRIIRTATLADLDAVAAVEAACFPAAEAATRAEFADRLAHYGGHFWLMFDGGALIAFVDGMVTDRADLTDDLYADASLHDAHGAWQMIFGVNTLPAYRRQGIAETLLRRATERLSAIDGLRIYGTTEDKCAIVSFNVEGVHPYDMGMILDKLGIAVRTGQHCAEPVMDHYATTGMCRASFALYNTLGEADALADGVARAVRMLR